MTGGQTQETDGKTPQMQMRVVIGGNSLPTARNIADFSCYELCKLRSRA